MGCAALGAPDLRALRALGAGAGPFLPDRCGWLGRPGGKAGGKGPGSDKLMSGLLANPGCLRGALPPEAELSSADDMLARLMVRSAAAGAGAWIPTAELGSGDCAGSDIANGLLAASNPLI